MPPVSVRLLRLSLLALLAGAALGGVLLAAEPWGSAWLPRFRAAHVQLMLFGWLGPFVLGTAYWILPRHPQGEGRGSSGQARAASILLQAGVLLGPAGALAGWSVVARAGSLAAISGVALFVGLLWPRVKAFGNGRVDGLTASPGPPE